MLVAHPRFQFPSQVRMNNSNGTKQQRARTQTYKKKQFEVVTAALDSSHGLQSGTSWNKPCLYSELLRTNNILHGSVDLKENSIYLSPDKSRNVALVLTCLYVRCKSLHYTRVVFGLVVGWSHQVLYQVALEPWVGLPPAHTSPFPVHVSIKTRSSSPSKTTRIGDPATVSRYLKRSILLRSSASSNQQIWSRKHTFVCPQQTSLKTPRRIFTANNHKLVFQITDPLPASWLALRAAHRLDSHRRHAGKRHTCKRQSASWDRNN